MFDVPRILFQGLLGLTILFLLISSSYPLSAHGNSSYGVERTAPGHLLTSRGTVLIVTSSIPLRQPPPTSWPRSTSHPITI